MGTEKKTHYHSVFIIKFYVPKVLAAIYGMNQELLLEKALLAGALYQVGKHKLINRVRLENFLKNADDRLLSMSGKYCHIKEAVKQMGIEREMLIKFATDAQALYKVENEMLVNLDKLEEYIESCRYTVNKVYEEEGINYLLSQYERSRNLCLK